GRTSAKTRRTRSSGLGLALVVDTLTGRPTATCKPGVPTANSLLGLGGAIRGSRNLARSPVPGAKIRRPYGHRTRLRWRGRRHGPCRPYARVVSGHHERGGGVGTRTGRHHAST